MAIKIRRFYNHRNEKQRLKCMRATFQQFACHDVFFLSTEFLHVCECVSGVSVSMGSCNKMLQNDVWNVAVIWLRHSISNIISIYGVGLIARARMRFMYIYKFPTRCSMCLCFRAWIHLVLYVSVVWYTQPLKAK